MTKPLLIYDGDCQFCIYWVNYWHKLTGESVDYRPYQEVAHLYPDISISEFKRAVQYIASDNKVSSAAKASFLVLNHAQGKQFWLWLYQKIPGFSFLTELMYAFIASNRSLSYQASLFFYGKNYQPPQYQLIIWLFLRGLGLIYFCAFASFTIQASGLIGSHGILPISDFTTLALQVLGTKSYWQWPMLFWINDSDFMLYFVCWSGMICSFCVTINFYPRINLILLYILYLSLIHAGQVFMMFQWDSYIVETGIIAFFLFDSPLLAVWLLRWLLFRFILCGGLVKLFSGDITWANLSALDYYFLTQPLPTSLAWYAYQLPSFILHTATALTLFIELIMPFFIFLPRRLRFMAAFAILTLQTAILFTGNYNFFNLLTLLLCLMLFDDAALHSIIPQRFYQFMMDKIIQIKQYKFISYTAIIFAVFTIFLGLIQFQLRFTQTTSSPLAELYQNVEPLRLVNPYGPFAVITTERIEIIIEGSDDEINWHAYEFKFKPGDIYQKPLWIIPHQPRLDWQMWFAALGTANDNPWFLQFLQRLLENSPPVLKLLKTNPFPDHAPKYIRAQSYQYYFTTLQEKKETGAWWKRDRLWFYLYNQTLPHNPS